MDNKVWVIYKEDGDSVSVWDDKVYLNKDTAVNDCKELNKNPMCSYYVDYLGVNKD